MQIIINPGSGPVQDADEETAIANMRHFIVDCDCDFKFYRVPEFDENGRYGFVVSRHGSPVAFVEMPGIPLEKVRFVNGATQDPWQFPRLYVDGSSWLWKFAVEILSERVKEEEED